MTKPLSKMNSASHTAIQHSTHMARRLSVPLLLAGGAILLLVLAALASLAFGSNPLSITQVLAGLFAPDGSLESALIQDIRLPRVVLALLIGVNLSVAGVLTQTLTSNPLASPQTFGINAGAALMIVLSMVLFPITAQWGTMFAAFLGATAVGVLMWMFSLSPLFTPLKLALAGISIQLVLAAIMQAILIANNAAQDIVYWLAGSLSTAQWAKVELILPFSLLGVTLALISRHHLSLLILDVTTSQSLGQNTRRIGGLAIFIVVILAGSAVAVAGPIGFIGLIIPHIVKRLVGEKLGLNIVLGSLIGALLLLTSDLLGKWLAYPSELPVGIVTAMIGAPAFLLITWKQRKS